MATNDATAEWLDAGFASRWTAADSLGDFLHLPRQITAEVVAADLGEPVEGITILDIGSGPGDYLAAQLAAMPVARGIWTDVSPAMYSMARERLALFGDRVSFEIVDMTELDALPAGLNLVTTSRASHHLDAAALAQFYSDVVAHLAPGGWLANLDHVTPADGWDQRLRAVRKTLIPPSEHKSGHAHPNPLPTIQDHLDGMRAAGLRDVEMPWRGLYTCLFMGRRDG